MHCKHLSIVLKHCFAPPKKTSLDLTQICVPHFAKLRINSDSSISDDRGAPKSEAMARFCCSLTHRSCQWQRKTISAEVYFIFGLKPCTNKWRTPQPDVTSVPVTDNQPKQTTTDSEKMRFVRMAPHMQTPYLLSKQAPIRGVMLPTLSSPPHICMLTGPADAPTGEYV